MNSYGLADGDQDEFIKDFVRSNNLESLERKVRGALTGDSTLTYAHDGPNGFVIGIDDDLDIEIMLQEKR